MLTPAQADPSRKMTKRITVVFRVAMLLVLLAATGSQSARGQLGGKTHQPPTIGGVPIRGATAGHPLFVGEGGGFAEDKGVFHVVGFGADPTGVADSTAAIQAALDAAIAGGGGTVYFPRGTYLLATPTGTLPNRRFLVWGNNLTLRGEGRGKTIIKLGNNVGSFRGIIQNSVFNNALENIRVSGITFDLSGSSQTTAPKSGGAHDIRLALDGANVDDLVVENCGFRDVDGTWVIVAQFGHVEIRDNLFEDIGDDTDIDHSTLYLSTGSGFVTGNTFIATRVGGRTAVETHGPYTVSDNQIIAYRKAMNITNIGSNAANRDVRGTVIDGNRIVQCREGISIWSSANTPLTAALPGAVDTTADTITLTAHGMADGDEVFVQVASADTLPAGLSSEAAYFVVGVTANTFQLSRKKGGTAVDLTSGGSGTLQVIRSVYRDVAVTGNTISVDRDYHAGLMGGTPTAAAIMWIPSGDFGVLHGLRIADNQIEFKSSANAGSGSDNRSSGIHLGGGTTRQYLFDCDVSDNTIMSALGNGVHVEGNTVRFRANGNRVINPGESNGGIADIFRSAFLFNNFVHSDLQLVGNYVIDDRPTKVMRAAFEFAGAAVLTNVRIADTTLRWADPAATYLLTNGTPTGVLLSHAGPGSPEGVVKAEVGSRWYRTDGGAGTTMYLKESGSGNTGWVAK